MKIAKMMTRYPEYKGTGYYNFVCADTDEELDQQIEMNSHDYILGTVVDIKMSDRGKFFKKYNTKEKLNKKFFNNNEEEE